MIVELDGQRPQVSSTAFIAPTAVLIGNVEVGDEASVWYGAVLRADSPGCRIIIGPRTSVQDNCVIHVAPDRGTVVGEGATIGHGAILEGCDIEDGAVVGMNAVVLQNARLGARSILAASGTILAGVQIPPDVLAAGSPATVKKPVSGEARWWVENAADHYVERTHRYLAQGLDTFPATSGQVPREKT